MIFRPGGRIDNRRIIMVLAAYVVVVATYLIFFLLPSLRELSSLHDSALTQQSTLEALNELQARHTEIIQQYDTALAKANDLYSRFPREADIPRILSEITSLTQNCGANQELLSFSKPVWKDGMGELKITAMFSGSFRQLAKLAIQLPQAIPSAVLDEVRFISILKGSTSDNTTTAQQSGGVFPGLTNSALVGAISNALGISAGNGGSKTVTTNISPLDIDHTEAHFTITVWLLAEDFVSKAANLPLRGWYARQAKSVDLPSIDPFVPSTKARELVAWRDVLDKLEQTSVTGIISAGGKAMASLQVMGTSYTVAVGNTIPLLNNAKVVSIQSDLKQVTLDISGQRIQLKMGGTAK